MPHKNILLMLLKTPQLFSMLLSIRSMEGPCKWSARCSWTLSIPNQTNIHSPASSAVICPLLCYSLPGIFDVFKIPCTYYCPYLEGCLTTWFLDCFYTFMVLFRSYFFVASLTRNWALILNCLIVNPTKRKKINSYAMLQSLYFTALIITIHILHFTHFCYISPHYTNGYVKQRFYSVMHS